MRNYQVEAIVLKRFNFGEADRLLWLFSKEKGLLRAKARSVRKIKAKLKGPLELFMNSKIELAKGKNIPTITGARIVNSYPDLRNDLLLTSIAYYFSEVLIGFLAEEEEDREIYDLLKKCLGLLSEKKAGLVVIYFLINLLGEAGFKPQLYRCIKCGDKIKQGGENRFSLKGGLICAKCGGKEEEVISDEVIKLYRLLVGKKEISDVKIKDGYIKEGREKLESFMVFLLEKEIKSGSFLEEMEKENA